MIGGQFAASVAAQEALTRLLGERLGLHAKWKPGQLALAVKEVLHPPGKAEERAGIIESRRGFFAR